MVLTLIKIVVIYASVGLVIAHLTDKFYCKKVYTYIKEKNLVIELKSTEDVIYVSVLMAIAIIWPVAVFYYLKGMFSAFIGKRR